MRKGRGIPIPLKYLQPIFAPDMDATKSARLFKARLKTDLIALAKVYDRFNVEIEGDILWLRKSNPPVPERQKVVRLL